ncbi:hypothetical protein JD844_010401 [Phrynosoma platyrhinos]|uniref:Uncharacterized protein n=1 Tax=Phrynosoma platyrhinos TaxID=52577 RepID=A0ABQ7TGF6_PHRPL|nr:hypothetical protein JD844_010401 [Phrynosoma platyrhinos]
MEDVDQRFYLSSDHFLPLKGVTLPVFGELLQLFAPELPPPDILLNVFLAIAVDNLADGDNINSSKEGEHKDKEAPAEGEQSTENEQKEVKLLPPPHNNNIFHLLFSKVECGEDEAAEEGSEEAGTNLSEDEEEEGDQQSLAESHLDKLEDIPKEKVVPIPDGSSFFCLSKTNP